MLKSNLQQTAKVAQRPLKEIILSIILVSVIVAVGYVLTDVLHLTLSETPRELVFGEE